MLTHLEVAVRAILEKFDISGLHSDRFLEAGNGLFMVTLLVVAAAEAVLNRWILLESLL